MTKYQPSLSSLWISFLSSFQRLTSNSRETVLGRFMKILSKSGSRMGCSPSSSFSSVLCIFFLPFYVGGDPLLFFSRSLIPLLLILRFEWLSSLRWIADPDSLESLEESVRLMPKASELYSKTLRRYQQTWGAWRLGTELWRHMIISVVAESTRQVDLRWWKRVVYLSADQSIFQSFRNYSIIMVTTSSMEYPKETSLLRRRDILEASWASSPLYCFPPSREPCINKPLQQTVQSPIIHHPHSVSIPYIITFPHYAAQLPGIQAPQPRRLKQGLPPGRFPRPPSLINNRRHRHALQVSQEGEELQAIHIETELPHQRVFYLGHGFGGTSLMYFPNFPHILNKGNIVLWELRGMGCARKLPSYPREQWEGKIHSFYTEGLERVISYFNHPKIVLLSHSFSCYVAFRYLLERPHLPQVEKVIMLSPIGLTPLTLDYKYNIRSCSDFFNSIFSKFCWRFNLTYKSPLRTICACAKKGILTRAFTPLPLTQKQVQICVSMFLKMVELPDGSESLFFDLFLPRVLPLENQSIVQIEQASEHGFTYPCSLYYGGEEDWVDREGARLLSEKLANVRSEVVAEASHMIPLYPEQIRKILEMEFSE